MEPAITRSANANAGVSIAKLRIRSNPDSVKNVLRRATQREKTKLPIRNDPELAVSPRSDNLGLSCYRSVDPLLGTRLEVIAE
ncbi:MAG: hypothetical protein JSW39_04135 [Desulfobacterales bacterium]|nr:MAG: hypothetical protein JSW39_04135 [Desulfobacterales bacterium]